MSENQVNCWQCGKEFTPVALRKIFCSDECSDKCDEETRATETRLALQRLQDYLQDNRTIFVKTAQHLNHETFHLFCVVPTTDKKQVQSVYMTFTFAAYLGYDKEEQERVSTNGLYFSSLPALRRTIEALSDRLFGDIAAIRIETV